MTVKELIQTAIDNLPEEQLDELYQLFPVENMVDKAKILGDMVSPVVDEEDWECLK